MEDKEEESNKLLNNMNILRRSNLEEINKIKNENEEKNKEIDELKNQIKDLTEKNKDNKVEEYGILEKKYYLLANEYNKLKNYYQQVYQQLEDLIKENEQLKNNDSKANENKYKEEYDKMTKLFNETKTKNIKLYYEIENLKKFIEDRKDIYKNYKIENMVNENSTPYDLSSIEKKYIASENISNMPDMKNEIKDDKKE